MIKTSELIDLLWKRAAAQKAGDNSQAEALQRSLSLMFPKVFCVACGHLAVRHNLRIEGQTSKPEEVNCEPCADEGAQAKNGAKEHHCPSLALGRPTQEIGIRRWTDPRPEGVPDDWLIFAATRPITGPRIWGDGRFFAAVNPRDEYAADFIYSNAKEDAKLIQYVTMKDVHEWAYRYFTQRGWETEGLERHGDDILKKSFRNACGHVYGHIIADDTFGWLPVAFDTLKDRIRMAKEIAAYGSLDEALKLLEEIHPLLPGRAMLSARKAIEEFKTGDPCAAGRKHLDDLFESIGETKIQ